MSDIQDPSLRVGVGAPADSKGPQRAALQERLGLRPEPGDEYDADAQEALDDFGGMMAGISLVQDGCGLYFIGLAKREDLGPITEDDRTMGPGWGYCGLVVTRRVAPLAMNTGDSAEYATNPVAQYFGVAAYIGEELRTPDGEVFATIWVIFDAEQDWKQAHLDRIKAFARRVEARIWERSPLAGQ